VKPVKGLFSPKFKVLMSLDTLGIRFERLHDIGHQGDQQRGLLRQCRDHRLPRQRDARQNFADKSRDRSEEAA
jgi:hypothetical protein